MNKTESLISTDGVRFNSSAFMDYCRDSAEQYQSADPFPSICIENVFSNEYLQSVLHEFPPLHQMNVKSGGKAVHVKGHLSDIDQMGITTRDLIHWMNSPKFLCALEALTGIKGLISDPYLSGGGLHCTATGGFLKVHADFNYHPRFKLSRRLNVLLYLNEHWESEWGGQIELWSRDMTSKIRSYDPLMGRMVVFSTDSDSFHGHPDPMSLPDGLTRKSIALYYYTSPTSEQQLMDSHTTLYRPRPDEVFKRVIPKPGAKVKKTILQSPNVKSKIGRIKKLYRTLKIKLLK